MKKKLLVFIVAYNAENHIAALLERIPQELWQQTKYETEVLIIDDASGDQTTQRANQWMLDTGHFVTVLRNPANQGYGGNQKIGYTYAIEKKYDVVALLHGDGQYPPEKIPELIAPILDGSAAAVFGSRMINKADALKGGMPKYKFFANILLTKFQNLMLRTRLSEYHSGFRAYSVAALRKIPFRYNSNDFSFDSEIIIQLLDMQLAIKEIPIPTHYGDEVCHVNGPKYATQVIRNTLISRLQRIHCYYSPRFDYKMEESPYEDKSDFPSSHRFAIDAIAPESVVLDIGCSSGYVAAQLKEKGCIVYGYDMATLPHSQQSFERYFKTNLDIDEIIIPEQVERIDAVLLLDVIEHLINPEEFLLQLQQKIARFQPKIFITTGNIGFVIVRLSLLFGQFNYGKKGILDLTHKRLFTYSSLRKLLENHGFIIKSASGIPVPWPLAFSNKAISSFLFKLNILAIYVSKRLFSFQIAMIAEPQPTLELLLSQAQACGKNELMESINRRAQNK